MERRWSKRGALQVRLYETAARKRITGFPGPPIGVFLPIGVVCRCVNKPQRKRRKQKEQRVSYYETMCG